MTNLVTAASEKLLYKFEQHNFTPIKREEIILTATLQQVKAIARQLSCTANCLNLPIY
jgi:hypothetical protein